MLSFFFDGVPDPSLVKSNEDALRFAKETGGIVYAHMPFANNQCGECHRNLSGESARQVQTDVCFRCHSAIASEHEKMHGAVAAGACVFCHSPHESTIKHLLKSRPPSICMQCHAEASFGDPPAPVHSDLKRDCLECHFGHGGPERFFLRNGWMNAVPGAPPVEPETLPATPAANDANGNAPEGSPATDPSGTPVTSSSNATSASPTGPAGGT